MEDGQGRERWQVFKGTGCMLQRGRPAGRGVLEAQVGVAVSKGSPLRPA